LENPILEKAVASLTLWKRLKLDRTERALIRRATGEEDGNCGA
jgi:hypothetical protein